MTNTNRRALIGAIAAAPVMLTAPAQAAPANLAALDEAALWEAGARSADPEFARLCADAILTQGRALAADRLDGDANDEAWNEASNARWRALRYPARSRDVLLLKASLRRCEAINAEESDEVETWSEIVADLNRVLAA